MGRKIQLPRDAVRASLPARGEAWEMHGAVCRKANAALLDHLRAERWVRNHASKNYVSDEYEERHRRLEAERRTARRLRTAWERAEAASQDAYNALPPSSQSAHYTRDEWCDRMGWARAHAK